MDIFSNKTLAEKNHGNLEEAMRLKLERLSGRESSQHFEFEVDVIAVNGGHVFLASNNPDSKPGSANAKIKAVIYRYSVYDGGIDKFCELETEVEQMHSMASANAIFVVCRNRQLGVIDLIRQTVHLPFEFQGKLFKIVAKPFQSKVYYLADNIIRVIKINGLEPTKKDLYKFDTEIVNFDVMVSEEKLLLLTDKWELLVYDQVLGTVSKVKHLIGPVLGMQYDDITSKIALIYPNGFYIYDFMSSTDEQHRSRTNSPDPAEAKVSASKVLSETMRSFRSKGDFNKTLRATFKEESHLIMAENSIKDHDNSMVTLGLDEPDIPLIKTAEAVPRKYGD